MTVLPRTDDPDNVISTENFGRLSVYGTIKLRRSTSNAMHYGK